MSRTVTALYDTRAEAEAARQSLSSHVDAASIRIIDHESSGSGGSGGLDNLFVSNEDRHAYGEGIRRGGFLLCAEVSGDEDADKIIRLLEQSTSVDLDQRQESWRSEGWTPSMSGTTGATAGAATAQTAQTAQPATTGRVVEEQRIPVIEEELRVGKREISRGGARVRSYVRETPVREQVTLREEHVEVERRPVDQPVSSTATSGAEGLLEERTIEMRETAEEAVVQKVASVKEEVVIRKTAEEHTEQVEDTVRRTEVEVEGEQGSRPAFGSFGGGSESQPGTPTSGDLNREDLTSGTRR
ncbi:MAG TPA: YsnF/AvaK domain-containing protein [Allosphingosinicella sp.]|jgi:uncharacterized protein (TIGR02271 family)